MFADGDIAINPVAFFGMRFDMLSCDASAPTSLAARYRLPDTTDLTGDYPEAEMRVGWSSEGLAFHVIVRSKFGRTVYPRIDLGDALELFIDTRDVKTSGFNTRFCHHFFFLPEMTEGHQKGELTHFRTEDAHPHCEINGLGLEVERSNTTYVYKIFIPSSCLIGYDIQQFKRIGFNYRIHVAGEAAQHLSAVTSDFRIEEQPSLWATGRMIS
ncbi:hypothetical protein SCG7086_AE_00120 [Chlamydiales bacterium SCGC AG-110-P3]|nr:hypothetical protein SCG7086_AE_00120 [Chlamydiales bacterium SCGC AG-110-P3]